MPGSHARLSASGSKRWTECPGSVGLEDLFPKEESSEYAEEGTLAHALGEAMLRNTLYGDNNDDLAEISMDVNQDMWDYITDYVDYCMDLYQQSKLRYKDTRAEVEFQVDYSRYAPEGWGTADFAVIGGPYLNVVDLKYGKGLPVKATNNTQTRLYALGVLEFYGDIYDTDTVKTHIFQPRLGNISVEKMDKDDLVQWGMTDLKQAADIAATGCGELVPGEHCRFCRARAVCRTRATRILKTVLKYVGGQNAGKTSSRARSGTNHSKKSGSVK